VFSEEKLECRDVHHLSDTIQNTCDSNLTMGKIYFGSQVSGVSVRGWLPLDFGPVVRQHIDREGVVNQSCPPLVEEK
jgi:hypothetical protein